MLVDIHCHLTFDEFKDNIDEVVERARKAGVISILCSGIDHESNLKCLELAKKYDIVNASLGIYPLDAVGLGCCDDVPRENREIDVDKELEFIKSKKNEIVAVGEIGLDKSPKEDCKLEEQKEVFRKCIRLAKEIDKPIIIHTRKAEKECLDILEEEKIKNVVLHCFTGNLKLVKRAEELGFYFSIPPVVVRLQHFQEIIKRVSLQNLLTETDAPFLSPYKDKKNEPSFVKETIKMISKIKNVEEKEVEKIIFSNYQKIFMKKAKT